MEIEATLEAPYTNDERTDFVMEYGGFILEETDERIIAWRNTEAEVLEQRKLCKYIEAKEEAYRFLDSGNALFELSPTQHIEATDGNIAKFTAYALAFVTGQLQPEDTVVWSTKEDENIELTQEQVSIILNGLGTVQAGVWTVQYAAYVNAIEAATTVEEVNSIIIEYSNHTEIEEEEE